MKTLITALCEFIELVEMNDTDKLFRSWLRQAQPIVLVCLTFQLGYAQNCEIYDRELMHFLPKDFPDTINCVDAFGKKQGCWIHYEVLYNDVPQPDVLAVGYYVPHYSFGRYKDDKKVGDWEYVENVHLVSTSKIEHYNYYGDSLVIITEKGPWFTQTLSIVSKMKNTYKIKYIIQDREPFPTIIECNKKSKKPNPCFIEYRNEIIKRFPINELEFHVDNYFAINERARFVIDRKKGASR